MNQTKKYTLVTGAGGFVGRPLCKELIDSGCLVKVALRHPEAFDIANVEKVSIGNIDSSTDWGASLSEVETVIHLAARVHIMKDSALNPLEEFLKVNLEGTINLANQAARAGVKRFVYLSSIKVSGEDANDATPFTEASTPNPHDPYAISKWRAEQSLQAIAHETGMEIVIIRPPLVYGPSVKANFLSLLKLVNRSLPLPLGSIKNRRSMVFIGNLVSAIIVASQHRSAAGQTYLVSDGDDVSTPQLIAQLALALNRPNRCFRFPLAFIHYAAALLGKKAASQRLTQSLVIDSNKIRSQLDWEAPFTLAEGLKITANWYKHTLQ